jgi:hypothetical protein
MARKATPAKEPKTRHIWMRDGRSLCDRRALVKVQFADHSEKEMKVHFDEQDDAPACGSCIVITANLRFQAATLIEQCLTVVPETVKESWEWMLETRWTQEFDIIEIAEEADASGEQMQSIFEALNMTAVRQRASEAIDASTASRERLIKTWRQYRQEPNP